MPSPPIQLFLTTIASAPVLRQRQEYLLRTLQVKKIPFVSYDLASDPNAKRLWRRKAPKEHQDIPGMLVGGVWPGTFEQFFEAVERSDLETFLRLKEDYDPELDGKVLKAPAIGVPGAALPEQMQGHKPSFAPNGPTPMKKSGAAGTGEELVDAGDVLPGYGFQGLKVTMNELTDLAKELGLNEKERNRISKRASTLVAGSSKQDTSVPSTSKTEKEEDKAPTTDNDKDVPQTEISTTIEDETAPTKKEGAEDETVTAKKEVAEEETVVAPLKLTKAVSEKAGEDAQPTE